MGKLDLTSTRRPNRNVTTQPVYQFYHIKYNILLFLLRALIALC